MYPASLTKVLTLDTVLNLEDDLSNRSHFTYDQLLYLIEEDASLAQMKYDYNYTLEDLLYGLILPSGADSALALENYFAAKGINLVDEMNRHALELGCTDSHFVNTTGLHDDDHYITAYDMYLILQEAEKYEIIREIDSYKTFTYSYTTADGLVLDDDITPTNQFLAGNYKLPSNITIDSWKTGTTNAAGNILAMNVTIDNNSYSLFVADARSQDDLYDKIGVLFNLTR